MCDGVMAVCSTMQYGTTLAGFDCYSDRGAPRPQPRFRERKKERRKEGKNERRKERKNERIFQPQTSPKSQTQSALGRKEEKKQQHFLL